MHLQQDWRRHVSRDGRWRAGERGLWPVVAALGLLALIAGCIAAAADMGILPHLPAEMTMLNDA